MTDPAGSSSPKIASVVECDSQVGLLETYAAKRFLARSLHHAVKVSSHT